MNDNFSIENTGVIFREIIEIRLKLDQTGTGSYI